jgi:hypothetical protein
VRKLDAHAVVHGISDSLLATKITLGGLHGDVTEEELDLFEFAARNVTESGACTPHIVRRNFLNADYLREVFNHVPNNLFRQPISPDDFALIDGSEKTTGCDS